MDQSPFKERSITHSAFLFFLGSHYPTIPLSKKKKTHTHTKQTHTILLLSFLFFWFSFITQLFHPSTILYSTPPPLHQPLLHLFSTKDSLVSFEFLSVHFSFDLAIPFSSDCKFVNAVNGVIVCALIDMFRGIHGSWRTRQRETRLWENVRLEEQQENHDFCFFLLLCWDGQEGIHANVKGMQSYAPSHGWRTGCCIRRSSSSHPRFPCSRSIFFFSSLSRRKLFNGLGESCFMQASQIPSFVSIFFPPSLLCFFQLSGCFFFFEPSLCFFCPLSPVPLSPVSHCGQPWMDLPWTW